MANAGVGVHGGMCVRGGGARCMALGVRAIRSATRACCASVSTPACRQTTACRSPASTSSASALSLAVSERSSSI